MSKSPIPENEKRQQREREREKKNPDLKLRRNSGKAPKIRTRKDRLKINHNFAVNAKDEFDESFG